MNKDDQIELLRLEVLDYIKMLETSTHSQTQPLQDVISVINRVRANLILGDDLPDAKEELNNIYNETRSLIKLNEEIDHVLWQAHFCLRCEESFLAQSLVETNKYKTERTKCLNGVLALLGFNKLKPFTPEALCARIEKSGDVLSAYLKTATKRPSSNITGWLYGEIYLPLFPKWSQMTPTEKATSLAESKNLQTLTETYAIN